MFVSLKLIEGFLRMEMKCTGYRKTSFPPITVPLFARIFAASLKS
jgi:hypothetical protein